MNALLRPFLAICLLRMGPQDLPVSGVLLGVALVAHAVSGTVSAALVVDPLRAFAAGVTGTLLLAALTVSLLYALRLQSRMVQTLTALAGADALIGLLAAPVMLYAYASAGQGAGAAGPLVLAIVVWSIAVFGHILRHALSTHMAVGVVVALIFYWVSIGLLNQLYVPAG